MAHGSSDILLGAIAGAHGVRGGVKIKTFTEDPSAIGDYGPVHTQDGRAFTLTVGKPVKGGMAATLDGVTTRDQAQALKGVRLYVPRAALGEVGADDDETYFHADLVGCCVVNEQDEEIGRVTAVHDFGAGDLLDVVRCDAAGTSVLVPFTRAVCPAVDIAARRIVCVPPAGLLDAPRTQKKGVSHG